MTEVKDIQNNPRTLKEQEGDRERDGYYAQIRKKTGIKPVVDVDASEEEDRKTLENPSEDAQRGIKKAKEDLKLPPRKAKRG